MELCEIHKYQKDYLHVIQLSGGSAVPMYLVIEQSNIYHSYRNFIKAFTRRDEAEEFINNIILSKKTH